MSRVAGAPRGLRLKRRAGPEPWQAVTPPETSDEGTSVSEANLRQVQDCPASWCGAGDLHQLETQAATGLNARASGLRPEA